MAYEIPGFVLGTLLAGDDLSSAQYRFVVGTAGDLIGVCGSAAQPLGVLQNAPEEGEVCQIMTSGVSKVICDDTVAEFGQIEVGTSGGADTLASGFSVGMALEAGVVNQIISVRLGDYGK
jgi:hypothetical protein